jgi:hypothetical protein
MKFLNLIFAFVILSVAASSCVTSKQMADFVFSRNAGMEPGGDYIILKNGNKIKGKVSDYRIAVYKASLNKKNFMVTMNGIVYDAKSILYFQKDSAAFAKLDKSELFTERKMFGKINVYYRHISEVEGVSLGKNYHYVYNKYWLQKGEAGKIKNFSINTLEAMVSDNPTALDLLQDYKNAKKGKKSDSDLVAVLEIYNRIKE